jgi:hypothetical protein
MSSIIFLLLSVLSNPKKSKHVFVKRTVSIIAIALTIAACELNLSSNTRPPTLISPPSGLQPTEALVPIGTGIFAPS